MNSVYPSDLFRNPEKLTKLLKSKIPQYALQSREDLYEQNMLTKMEVHSLRNENRKINTKLVVLEQQLAQKDKLFEDMYRAAFERTRHPQNAPSATNANIFHPQPAGNQLANLSVQKNSFPNAPGSLSSQQHAQA